MMEPAPDENAEEPENGYNQDCFAGGLSLCLRHSRSISASIPRVEWAQLIFAAELESAAERARCMYEGNEKHEQKELSASASPSCSMHCRDCRRHLWLDRGCAHGLCNQLEESDQVKHNM